MIQILNIAGNSSIQNRKIKRAARRPHVSDNKYAELGICLSLICSFAQITQIKWATVSDSLRSLRTNEWLWANRSGCSCQKSDRKWIAQVAHDKRATVRDLLRSLMINEQIASFFWANRSLALSLTKKRAVCSKKLKNWLKSYFSVCFCTFF